MLCQPIRVQYWPMVWQKHISRRKPTQLKRNEVRKAETKAKSVPSSAMSWSLSSNSPRLGKCWDISWNIWFYVLTLHCEVFCDDELEWVLNLSHHHQHLQEASLHRQRYVFHLRKGFKIIKNNPNFVTNNKNLPTLLESDTELVRTKIVKFHILKGFSFCWYFIDFLKSSLNRPLSRTACW